jgi:hypothetical protein
MLMPAGPSLQQNLATAWRPAHRVPSSSELNVRLHSSDVCISSGSSAPGRRAAPSIMSSWPAASRDPVSAKRPLGSASMSVVTLPCLAGFGWGRAPASAARRGQQRARVAGRASHGPPTAAVSAPAPRLVTPIDTQLHLGASRQEPAPTCSAAQADSRRWLCTPGSGTAPGQRRGPASAPARCCRLGRGVVGWFGLVWVGRVEKARRVGSGARSCRRGEFRRGVAGVGWWLLTGTARGSRRHRRAPSRRRPGGGAGRAGWAVSKCEEARGTAPPPARPPGRAPPPPA